MNKTHSAARPGGRRLLALGLAALLLLALERPLPARAETTAADSKKEQLQQEIDKAEENLKNIQKQLEQAATDRKDIEEQRGLQQQKKKEILGQISTINEMMEEISTQMQQLTAAILQKQQEVDAKQAEFDERWAGFKERMGAMQMLNDGGSIALLSSVTNLYELLTFSQTLEDIAAKDHQMCLELEEERAALNAEKAELEADKAALEQHEQELQAQQTSLSGKQQELAKSIQALDGKLTDAEALEQALSESESEAEKEFQRAVYAMDAYLNAQNNKYESSASTVAPNENGFGIPVQSGYVSQAYGRNGHTGVDIATGAGTPIYAVANGVVTISHVWDGVTKTGNESYGNFVQIRHSDMGDGNSYSTLYAHMVQAPSVSEGQVVMRGDVLGYVGNTGHSFGNHLHLEMKINGSRVNPLSKVPLP